MANQGNHNICVGQEHGHQIFILILADSLCLTPCVLLLQALLNIRRPHTAISKVIFTRVLVPYSSLTSVRFSHKVEHHPCEQQDRRSRATLTYFLSSYFRLCKLVNSHVFGVILLHSTLKRNTKQKGTLGRC